MRFFLCVFTAMILFSSVSFAQGHGVLANGNPPLTTEMIDRLTRLMEWSLDSEFSGEERDRLKTVVISYWTNGDEKSIRSVLDMLAFEEKLATAGEDRKRNLQPQVQGELLKTMRQDASEPMNRVLLAVYERNQTARNDPINAVSQNVGTIQNLVGRWQTSHANSLRTQNVYSGALGGGNGMVAEYDIRPNGSVIFSLFLTQNNYGCTTKIKTSKTGRVTVSENRVTFDYEKGTTVSSDSCNAKNNYTKPLGRSSETFEYKLTRENGRPQFCFANDRLKDCAVKQD